MMKARISKLKAGVVLPACLLTAGLIGALRCGTGGKEASIDTRRSAVTLANAETSQAWWKLARPANGTVLGPSLAAILPSNRGLELITVSTPVSGFTSLSAYGSRSNIELKGIGGLTINSVVSPDDTAVAAASIDGTSFDVFWRNADRTMATKQWNGANFVTSGTLPYGLTLAGLAAAGKADRVDVFHVGTDHNLYQAYRIGASWAGWYNIPVPAGGLASLPPAAVWTPDALWVFAVASDGTVRYTRNQNSPTWDPWVNLGGSAQSGVAVTIVGSRIDVFVADGSNIVWRNSTDGGATWTPSNSWQAVQPTINVRNVVIEGISRRVAPT